MADLMDTTNWPKEKDEVLKMFLTYLAEVGLTMHKQMMELYGSSSTPITVGPMGIILGTIIGAELAKRDEALADKLIETMAKTADRNPVSSALGGFNQVIEKANNEISILIMAWDMAE